MNKIVIAIAVLFTQAPQPQDSDLRGTKWNFKGVEHEACYYGDNCIRYFEVPGKLNDCDITAKGEIRFGNVDAAWNRQYLFKCVNEFQRDYNGNPETKEFTRTYKGSITQFRIVNKQGKALLLFKDNGFYEMVKFSDDNLVLKGVSKPNGEDIANLRLRGLKPPLYIRSVLTYERS